MLTLHTSYDTFAKTLEHMLGDTHAPSLIKGNLLKPLRGGVTIANPAGAYQKSAFELGILCIGNDGEEAYIQQTYHPTEHIPTDSFGEQGRGLGKYQVDQAEGDSLRAMVHVAKDYFTSTLDDPSSTRLFAGLLYWIATSEGQATLGNSVRARAIFIDARDRNNASAVVGLRQQLNRTKRYVR